MYLFCVSFKNRSEKNDLKKCVKTIILKDMTPPPTPGTFPFIVASLIELNGLTCDKQIM